MIDEESDIVFGTQNRRRRSARVARRPSTTGGAAGKRLVYHGTVSQFAAKFAQCIAVRGQRAFIVSFAVQAERFDVEYPRVCATCFDTFAFTDDDADEGGDIVN